MEIRLHNSLTRALELFTPAQPGYVTMYVCGPTVYDTPHLGNARPAVVFDVLKRLFMHKYGIDKVEYARNITDIDDKIMERAKENGETIEALTERTIAEYHEIMDQLGNTKPRHEPRATSNIAPIKGMITQLLLEGHAYEVGGNVLFDIESYPNHGILSGHKQEDLDAGHRVATADYKRSPGDFILWKPSTDDQPGWDSLWGRGRPGWHIECSAMIDEIFASQTIDIHGGGADLRFPHHECEISQYGACNHRPLANYWMHNAMVTVDGQKMAKSAGNFITVRDMLGKGVHGQALRLALLMSHYRSPLDWTDGLVAQARQTLSQWHMALEMVDAPSEYNEHADAILGALASDLNTPLAIAKIHEKIGDVASDPEAIASGVRYAAGMMGIDLVNNDGYLRSHPERDKIEALLADRNTARSNKDFVESDRIRDLLSSMGLMIEDRQGVTKWRRC